MREVKLIFLVLQNGRIMKNKWAGKLVKFFFVSISVSLVLVVILFVMVAYVRNWDGGDGVCSDMSKSEIIGYIEKYAKQKGVSDVVFDENFEYIKDLHQWKVPYRTDGHRYVAKMTCLGVILENVGPYD
ncbi:hypothetical protein [Burkholderia sp. SIMBA_062]|uniref:hypothetical protein n=1 Tax=Burkholderia sp. SIMBA_062 TaxID=3085803 RepID=UPI00397DCD3B